MKYLTVFILFSGNLIFGQININWPKNSFSDFKHKPDSIYESWNDFNTDVLELQKESYSKGLLEFSIDSLNTVDSISFTPYITFGKPYSWNSINLIHTGIKVPTAVISKWKNKLVTPNDLIIRIDQIVHFFQKNGYPFTSVKMDSIKLDNKKLSGYLAINPGPKIIWDTLTIIGDITLAKYYLQNYLGVKAGKAYNELVFLEAQKKN